MAAAPEKLIELEKGRRSTCVGSARAKVRRSGANYCPRNTRDRKSNSWKTFEPPDFWNWGNNGPLLLNLYPRVEIWNVNLKFKTRRIVLYSLRSK